MNKCKKCKQEEIGHIPVRGCNQFISSEISNNHSLETSRKTGDTEPEGFESSSLFPSGSVNHYTNLVLGATRMYSKENVHAWRLAEENLGLKKSVFITINGTTTQYYDADEGEKFFESVKRGMKEDDWFNAWCGQYLNAIKVKDKVKQFEALAIFNEIDEHPEIATDDQLRRLKRIRESTHEEIYKLKKGSDNPVQGCGNKAQLSYYHPNKSTKWD